MLGLRIGYRRRTIWGANKYHRYKVVPLRRKENNKSAPSPLYTRPPSRTHGYPYICPRTKYPLPFLFNVQHRHADKFKPNKERHEYSGGSPRLNLPTTLRATMSPNPTRAVTPPATARFFLTMMVLIFFCGGFGAGLCCDESSCRLISTRRYDLSDSTQPIVDNVIRRTTPCIQEQQSPIPHPTIRLFVHSITNE
jgi:hypothetical protein